MNRTAQFAALAALVLLAGCGQRQNAPQVAQKTVSVKASAPLGGAIGSMPGTDSLKTEDFIVNTVGGSLYSIKAAEIAEARARTPEVKTFARSLSEDHEAARDELTGAAHRSGDGALTPNAPTSRQQSMLALLRRDPPANFDQTYVEQQVQTHEDTLKLLTDYAATGASPSLKAAAADLIPRVQTRLDQARGLEERLNKP